MVEKNCEKCLHLQICKFHQEMLNVSKEPMFQAHPLLFNSLIYTFEVELPCKFFKENKENNAEKN